MLPSPHARGVLDQLLAFVPVIAILGLVPGTNNLLVLRTAAEVGAGPAGSVALGASAGIVAWSAAAGLGVGGLVVAVPGGLHTIGVAGSLAMVGVGLWALVPRPLQPKPQPGLYPAVRPGPRHRGGGQQASMHSMEVLTSEVPIQTDSTIQI